MYYGVVSLVLFLPAGRATCRRLRERAAARVRRAEIDDYIDSILNEVRQRTGCRPGAGWR